MSIKLEIIDFSAERVTAAFYWSVPVGDQLDGAVDATRTPSGSALSAQELQDLKDGKLYTSRSGPSTPAATRSAS